MALSSGANFRALRSLSRALLRGYFRDRTALAFSILLPVLFLVLFGALYRTSGAPKLTVIEIGKVSLVSHAASQPGLAGVLTVTHYGDKQAAVREVRRGNADAAVEQMGRQLIVHYSIASPTTAGIVQAVFSSIVQQADQVQAGPAGYQLVTKQVESTALKPIQFLAPGLLGWAVASGAAFGAAITLVNWREHKLLRRLRLAPVNTGSVVLARVGVARCRAWRTRSGKLAGADDTARERPAGTRPGRRRGNLPGTSQAPGTGRDRRLWSLRAERNDRGGDR